MHDLALTAATSKLSNNGRRTFPAGRQSDVKLGDVFEKNFYLWQVEDNQPEQGNPLKYKS